MVSVSDASGGLGRTKLPFRGAHGLHHPDGQRRFQDGHAHISKAQRPFIGTEGQLIIPDKLIIPPPTSDKKPSEQKLLTCTDQDVGIF